LSGTGLLILSSILLTGIVTWMALELMGKIARSRNEPFLEPFRRLAQQFAGTISNGFFARTIDATDGSEFMGHYAGYPFTATLVIMGSQTLSLSKAGKVFPSYLSICLNLNQASRFYVGFINDSSNKVLIGKTFKTGDKEFDQKFSMYTYRLNPAKRYVADPRNLGAIQEIYHRGWQINKIGKKSVTASLDFKWGEFDPSMIEAELVKKCMDQLILLAEGLKRAS
jgi:hypothetical protein